MSDTNLRIHQLANTGIALLFMSLTHVINVCQCDITVVLVLPGQGSQYVGMLRQQKDGPQALLRAMVTISGLVWME